MPKVYKVSDWINDYIKYKQLMKIPLIKNFNMQNYSNYGLDIIAKSKELFIQKSSKKEQYLLNPVY